MSWQTIRVSDVLIDARSGFACGEEPSEGVFQFRMNNVTTEGTLNLSKKRRVPATTRNIDAFLVESGDVLFNATNSPELVGKTVYFPGHEEPVVFSNHFLRLRPSPEKLDGRFLARWLHLQFQQRIFQGMCHQWVNQATVRRDSLLALTVPLPPLKDQQRIAEILDRAEALRGKRRAALSQLDTLTQAIFLDFFGNPTMNPKGWPMLPFGEICESRLGKMLDQKQQTGKHLRPYLRNANVQWFRFDLTTVFKMDFDESARTELRLKNGDLLICEGGEPGRAAIWKGQLAECYYQKALHRARPNTTSANSEYLAWLLFFLSTRGGLGDHVTSATIAHLTGAKLKAMRIPLPPIDLQREFARQVAAIEKLKTAHRASLAEMDALFASLQHRAFRGAL